MNKELKKKIGLAVLVTLLCIYLWALLTAYFVVFGWVGIVGLVGFFALLFIIKTALDWVLF